MKALARSIRDSIPKSLPFDGHARTLLVFCGLGILALLVRVLFLLLSDNYDGDAYARLVLSRQVADEGVWNPYEVWLPSHFWILGAFCRLGIYSQFGLRMVTAFAGAATIPVLFLLVRRIYDEPRAILVSLLFCLNPLHIRFSTLTVSEAFFILLLTVGFWAFDRHQERGEINCLLAGGIAMNLACGMRLEGWLFLPALLAWVLLKYNRDELYTRIVRASVFVALCSCFPVAWMRFSYLKYGDPLHVASMTRETNIANSIYQSTGFFYIVMFWPALLVAILGPSLPPFLEGAARTLKGRKRFFGALFIGFLGIYYVQNFRSAMITQARYGLLLVWILYLCLGEYPLKPGGLFSAKGLRGMAVAWLLIVWGLASAPLGYVSEKFSSISPCPRFDPDVRRVDQWLRQRGPQIPILIGPLVDQFEPWMSGFDEWYPVSEVVAIKSLTDLSKHINSKDRSGVWVADRKWLEKEHWNLVPLIQEGLLRTEFRTDNFIVFGWGATVNPKVSQIDKWQILGPRHGADQDLCEKALKRAFNSSDRQEVGS